MDALNNLAKQLEPVFSGLPALPKGGKEWLVKAWPIIAIIVGVLQLFAAWALWNLGHVVNTINQYAYMYSNSAPAQPLGMIYWLSLLVLIADAIVLLLAYPGLKNRTRDGWNFLLLSAIINVVYGLLFSFDGYYGGIGRLFSSLIGSAIGLYFLYQVLPYYKTK